MTTECPTCAERGYDNADYQRLHNAWCDSVAEVNRLCKLIPVVKQAERVAQLSAEYGTASIALLSLGREARDALADLQQ